MKGSCRIGFSDWPWIGASAKRRNGLEAKAV